MIFGITPDFGNIITTLADPAEVHPAELVTAQVYVPDTIPVIVELVPVPVVVAPPGAMVNVHVPVAGKPFNTTLPVETVQVGRVMVPTVGAVGTEGGTLITTLADDAELHPDELDTV